MLGPFGLGLGGGSREKREPPFLSRMSIPPERSIVLLGAGASAGAGCPVMRGFIDLAIDFLDSNVFTKSEAEDINATLKLYRALRRNFSITEEDVENIETILSLADLESIVEDGPIPELSNPGISNSVRSFIERVITKAGRAASQTSPRWLEPRSDRPMVYYYLVHALAHQKDKVTVITLNYDCLLEYTCYCLGVPFTYNHLLGEGVEILKLHGSINWLRCSNEGCSRNLTVQISPLEYVPSGNDPNEGYIDRMDKTCGSCGEKLIPVIVPPTWTKQLDKKFIQPFWKRSLDLLRQCESFVAAGYSLPTSDSHVRHLLHLGFSSNKLRHALSIVGTDAESAERWSRFFRESWRSSRFEVRNRTFVESTQEDIYSALVLEFDDIERPRSRYAVPPLSKSAKQKREIMKMVLEKDGKNEETVKKMLRNVEWRNVCIKLREGTPGTNEKYNNIVEKAGLLWEPSGDILPSHGSILVKPDRKP
ncbi:hypothetical protein ACFL54_04170 [Planctomycetota bacterium]